MKMIKKSLIQSDKHKQNCLVEKNILLNSINPFIIKLYYTFQDNNNLYFILDYVEQGDLYHFLLNNLKNLSEKYTVFIIAQIILGLQYLHENNYIYRDLKPENILINRKGYIKLADFGLSKIKTEKEDKCQTICGTLYYMAPEIMFESQGYDESVDWWSLGIILYEIYHGLPPFYQSKNQMEILQKYNEEQIQINSDINPNARDLIHKLLQKKPKDRIGYQNVDDIKNHSYFKDINWKKLYNQSLKAPKIHNLNKSLAKTEIFNFKEDNEHQISSYCKISNFTCSNNQ
ncbi:protein kinase domain protein [Ichthyophthirius multifiliis]|uniref:Protein kinase domain protein n=1 Tax=Ichthyophthirius multifiliis TaxID=5932 RepID=G0R427_ICHMU|nr:protein kinase domain protein [Ichthyophthirius multifiliis]EGR27779.1 protein kinase domain protein [Ichthyophthirius multifiliis]|eukprot:XP_004026846.1 protein kinase domain protein [Ichthyophthirius multifiliis]